MPAILGARPVLRRPHSPPRRKEELGGKDGERATRAAELIRVKAPGLAVALAFSRPEEGVGEWHWPNRIVRHLCRHRHFLLLAQSKVAATSPPCLEQKLATCTVRGTGHMTYYYDAATAELEHEFQRLRFKQRHRAEQNGSNQGMTPAIKMLIGDWQVDELGILTREIKARD